MHFFAADASQETLRFVSLVSKRSNSEPHETFPPLVSENICNRGCRLGRRTGQRWRRRFGYRYRKEN
jgi:hypothetical protein